MNLDRILRLAWAALVVAWLGVGAASVHAASADLPHPAEEATPTEPAQVPAPRPEVVSGEVRTPRFRILHTPASEGPAHALAERIEGVRDAFEKVLGRDWPGVTEIRLANGRKEMEALALPGGRPPAWAEALAYPRHNVMLLEARSLAGPRGEATLRHELAHVALGRLAEGWPRWFQEGLAMYLTGDRFSMSQYSALFRGVTQERLMSFEDLSRGWPEHPGDVEIAYAQSVSFVEFLVARHGSARMAELIDSMRLGHGFEGAFARAFLTTLSLEEGVWKDELPARYGWMPIITGGSTLWVLAAGLTIVGGLRRRRQRRERLAEMEAEEAAAEAARRIAEAEAQAQALALAAGAESDSQQRSADAAPDAERLEPGETDPEAAAPISDLESWPDDDKPKRILH